MGRALKIAVRFGHHVDVRRVLKSVGVNGKN